MTFEERKEKIENFKKLTYERFSIHSYIDLTTNCDEIINYLLESLEKFPNSPLPSRISDYWFRELSLIFSKSTAHWNSFDLRLLNILSSSGYLPARARGRRRCARARCARRWRPRACRAR